LAADPTWTIVGSSPLSKTYRRQDFLNEVIGPFNARMSEPLCRPSETFTLTVIW
jgi:uncharacterized protein